MKVNLRVEFLSKQFRRDLLKLLFIFMLTILQEAIFLAVQLNIPQDTLNYSDVESIFEKVMPMETYANRFSAYGEFTGPVFKDYRSVQN